MDDGAQSADVDLAIEWVGLMVRALRRASEMEDAKTSANSAPPEDLTETPPTLKESSGSLKEILLTSRAEEGE